MNPFLSKVLLTTLILVVTILTITLVDISKAKLNKNNKIFWVVVVLLFNIFGAMIYLFFSKKNT